MSFPQDPASSDRDLEAAQRFEAEGNLEAALRAYERAQLHREAARIAWSLGRKDEAARLSADAGLHYEAALCHTELGELDRALYHLVRTSPTDPRYRDACVRAIHLADKLERFDLRLDAFLTRWLQGAPRSSAEVEALLRLAPLYSRHGFGDQAERLLSSLEVKDGSGPHRVAPAPVDLAGDTSVEISGELDIPALLDMPTASAEAQALEEERSFRARKRRVRFPTPPEIVDDALVEEGAVIANRYRLMRRLGHGGMAVVFEADDLELGERVAVKVLKSLIEDEDAEQRFKREVSLSRRLNHPNIVKVYDIGKVRGHKFITMELLEGRDLETILEEKVRLSLKEGIVYLMQICAGLQAAHDQGIVHRDIKPPNFFVIGDQRLKIMDFGIAKHHRAPRLTSTGVIMGTPEYISPEQIVDFASATHTADIYAVGVVAYRMFVGTLPFMAEQVMDLLAKQMHEPPPPPRKYCPDLPEEVERIILKLLEKNPEDRYPTCAALVADLERLPVE